MILNADSLFTEMPGHCSKLIRKHNFVQISIILNYDIDRKLFPGFDVKKNTLRIFDKIK